MPVSAKPTRKQKREQEGRLLEAAFQRLLSQSPADNMLEDDELREMLEENLRVPVTQITVAQEAGLSRKLLTGDDSRFKELAARIKGVKSTHAVLPSTTAKMDKLQQELDEARGIIRVIRSKMAEAILKTDRAEAAVRQEKAQVERLRRQLAGRGRTA